MYWLVISHYCFLTNGNDKIARENAPCRVWHLYGILLSAKLENISFSLITRYTQWSS